MKKAKVLFQVNFTKAQAAFAAGSRRSQCSSSPHWQPCSCERVIWGFWGGGKSSGFGCCGLCWGGAGRVPVLLTSHQSRLEAGGAGVGPSLADGSDGWEGGSQCLGWVELSCLSHSSLFQGQSRGQSYPDAV